LNIIGAMKWLLGVLFIVFLGFGLRKFFVLQQDIVVPKQDIVIYCGEGVDEDCFRWTWRCVSTYAALNRFNVKAINSDEIRDTDWEKSTAVFIIPGGASVPYGKKLHGIGCQKIRDFVKNGGKYLGICAGSYFGGRRVEFAMGTDSEIVVQHELEFFPGTVSGPFLKPYVVNSNAGACAAKIKVDALNTSFFSYYNGGGVFIDAEKLPNIDIIGTYEDRENLAAIILCNIGRGIAILSSVHFEVEPEALEQKGDDSILDVAEQIRSTDSTRIKLIEDLFLRLDIR
jgi:glutamine amidotransferase-like uncharacterized protein